MDKTKKSYRFNSRVLSELDELKKMEEKFAFDFQTDAKTERQIIEDAIDFYFNFRKDQTKTYGFAPGLERTIQTSLKEYMDPLIKFWNLNQYHIYYIERLAKLILYSTDLAGDESEMINILNGEPLFEKVIEEDIFKKEGVKK